MPTAPPIFCDWNGQAFMPSTSLWMGRAQQYFTPGERYQLEIQEERSVVSHNHYFACIDEAWLNLPEEQADRFPTPDHLRRYALIRTGYRDERSIVCASKAEAQRVAAFVKPMDSYAVVIVREATVIVLTAQSQSKKAMGGPRFQESKTKVLDYIADMIGVSSTELGKANAA